MESSKSSLFDTLPNEILNIIAGINVPPPETTFSFKVEGNSGWMYMMRGEDIVSIRIMDIKKVSGEPCINSRSPGGVNLTKDLLEEFIIALKFNSPCSSYLGHPSTKLIMDEKTIRIVSPTVKIAVKNNESTRLSLCAALEDYIVIRSPMSIRSIPGESPRGINV